MKGTADDGVVSPAGSAAGGKAELLSGIERDARAEADKIVAAAEQAAAERRRSAEAQAAAIREDARLRTEEAVRGIARLAEQAAGVQTRRMALKVREEISRRILAEATRKLALMVEDPAQRAAYREVICGWIVEAAIGLNVEEAEVLASGPEMAFIDDALLRRAEEEARAVSGAAVRLIRSAKTPLLRQGVVLTAKDGRMAFNNQVPTRMERCRSEIRKLAYEALKES